MCKAEEVENENMTDYQFKRYEKLRDERDTLKIKCEALKQEIAQLKKQD